MKKFLLITLSCLLCLSLTVPALANEWGLRGGVYDIVSDSDRYEGYTAIADDGNKQWEGSHVNHAILQNRYHSLLIAARREGGCWEAETISTTAVFQPGDPRGEYPNTPALWHDDQGFVLKYGDNGPSERYSFVYSEELGDYILRDVRFYKEDEWYNDSFIRHNEGLLFWQSGPGETFLPIGDALWETDEITLSEFNIAQMPRSMAEVRNISRTAETLRWNGEELAVRTVWKDAENKRSLPVYSAPDRESYRSGSGKASVSTGGEIEIYGTFGGWTLVGYEVSPRTRRIGYVEGELAADLPLNFAAVPLVTQADTFLTDDPFASQFVQASIPAGTEVTGLAKCGEFYAYAEVSLGGTLYRGFIPMKDLLTKYDLALTIGEDLLMADVRWDVMDALTGKWYPVGGSYDDKMILYSNGEYRNHMPGDDTAGKTVGNFRVYDVESSDGSTYEMYLRTEDNQEFTWSLRLNEDGTISLSTDKMETVYRRDEYSTYGNG